MNTLLRGPIDDVAYQSMKFLGDAVLEKKIFKGSPFIVKEFLIHLSIPENRFNFNPRIMILTLIV